MNSKLFKPLNEQIQVVKIKRQGIDDAERDSLIESIINENVIESLTEDVDMAALYEQCLIEAGYDEARADELLLELFGGFYRARYRAFNKKDEKAKADKKTGDIYNDVSVMHAEDDDKTFNKIDQKHNNALDAANRMDGSNWFKRLQKKHAYNKAEREYEKASWKANKEIYKRNKKEVKDIDNELKIKQANRDLDAKLKKNAEKTNELRDSINSRLKQNIGKRNEQKYDNKAALTKEAITNKFDLKKTNPEEYEKTYSEKAVKDRIEDGKKAEKEAAAKRELEEKRLDSMKNSNNTSYSDSSSDSSSENNSSSKNEFQVPIYDKKPEEEKKDTTTEETKK